MSEKVAFKAHARLLTMLGEQLIKNERIALVELVKNSYDADATEVIVDFRGFGPNFAVRPNSTIVVTDNGSGMSDEVVRTSWMNPASPGKAVEKTLNAVTKRGRVLQGEKGIGRFATFKLGSNVAMTTRSAGSPHETTLLIDIAELDDAPDSAARRMNFFLEDLTALLETTVPHVFLPTGAASSSSGTRLEIRGLRAQWTAQLVEDAFADLDRLQPQLWVEGSGAAVKADFAVTFTKDGVDLQLGAERTEEFQAVLERAVLKVTGGRFLEADQRFEFSVNGRHYSLDLADSDITGLRRFRERFKNVDGTWRRPESGPFGFEFYIFDFSNSAPAKHSLDPQEKSILREHRIYLYRDGIRVYPYGDPKDDWLEVDAIRGTESARSMFSNDQSVGYVSITQTKNPELKDKTNREGLLETGRATGDFVALIQSVLSFLRSKPYEQYATANRRARERVLKEHRLDRHIQSLREDFTLPKKALGHLDALEAALGAERELSAMQVARTEQLAGVGLSVETASHDLIAASSEALRTARQIVESLRLHDLMGDPVYVVATSLVTRLEFISARFKDVQGLFVSTRQKQSKLDIAQLTRKVRSMYAGLHKHEGIEFQIDDSFKLTAVSTEAAVLQCLINLVDNSTFWLMTSPHRPRLLRAFSISDRAFALTDNGPGVKPEDQAFIFEAFYSGKGDAGKGLGLYIAQQNGLRNGFLVELKNDGDPRNLPGATFVTTFAETEKR